MNRRLTICLGVALLLTFGALTQRQLLTRVGERVVQKFRGRATVEERLAQYGAGARERWAPDFRRAGVSYPPRRLVLAGFKEERELRVYAADEGSLAWIRTYPILGASGELGPKLREGDRQVPEGVYRVESLNPNSAYHLALRVSYPNDFDRAQAEREARTHLGGNIMIHGSNTSVGCLAMGDEAAEDLFCLAAEKWPQEITILLCPRDLRHKSAPKIEKPPWAKEIYADLKKELTKLPDKS